MTLTLNLKDRAFSVIDNEMAQMHGEFKQEFQQAQYGDIYKLIEIFAQMCALNQHQMNTHHHESVHHNIQHIKSKVGEHQDTLGVLGVLNVAIPLLYTMAGVAALAGPIGLFTKLIEAQGSVAKGLEGLSNAAQLGAKGLESYHNIDKEKTEAERIGLRHEEEMAKLTRDQQNQASQQAQANVDKNLRTIEELRQNKYQAKQQMSQRA